MGILANIGISIAVVIATAFGLVNYMPLSWLETGQEQVFGSTITTIQATDKIKDSRAIINTNFSNLNSTKMENSTSSVASITTLSNLASVGTITTGVWQGTAVDVNYGGTGTTSPTQYMTILGNGSDGLTHASTTGTSGQVLTSNGAGSYPSWQADTTDQSANYTWTGEHTFQASTTISGSPLNITSATTSISSATTTLDGTNPILGIGTTTPTIQDGGLSVAGDTYITGGLGVGQATSSDGNLRVSNYLQVDGTASTTNLIFSGTITGLDIVSTTTAAITGPTTDNSYVNGNAVCTGGRQAIGGGVDMANGLTSPPVINASYQLNSTTWRVVVACEIGGGCDANTFTANAICIKAE